MMKRVFFLLIPFVISCGADPLVEKSSNNSNTQNLSCNRNSGQVCAQPPMPPCPPNVYCIQVMPEPTTYENECAMMEANARLIRPGSCD